jgi:hypothetical protein
MPRHAFVTGKAQGSDATIASANEWNAALIPITSTCTAVNSPGTAVPLSIAVGLSGQTLYVDECDITCDGDNDADVATVANGSVVGQRIDLQVVSVSGSTTNTLTISATFVGGATTYVLPWAGVALVGSRMSIVWDGTGWQVCGIANTYCADCIEVLETMTNDPPPLAGNLLIYSKLIGGRVMPKWIGPSGVDTPFQPFLGFNGIKQVAPATGTTAATCMSAFATAFTNTASAFVQVAVTSTSLKTWMRSVTLATSATAGNVASHRTSQAECCGQGGFFFTMRFYLSVNIATGLGFAGLWGAVAAPGATINPTTDFTVAKVGIGWTTNTGNLKLVASTTAAAMATVDLTNCPINTTDVIELVLFRKPADSTIYYRVSNLTSGVILSGSITGNIPATTVAMCPLLSISNNAAASACTVGLNKWYLESDY